MLYNVFCIYFLHETITKLDKYSVYENNAISEEFEINLNFGLDSA